VPSGWERFGNISLNKSASGGQDAEAIIFWTGFPDGQADPCANLPTGQDGGSVGDLAAAVASAPGTELVAGPSDVTLGGHAAKHVVVTVRENLGCDPGFFFTWEDEELGALWPETSQGDTIRVWIVQVDGKRLFIEAETNPEAGPELEQEVERIVSSISFDPLAQARGGEDSSPARAYIARTTAICAAAQANLGAELARLVAAGVETHYSPDPGDLKALYELLASWTEETLVHLRTVPPPKAIRAQFNRDYTLLEREAEALRRAATSGELELAGGPASDLVAASLQACSGGGRVARLANAG
jgi:hypothetical protein